MPAGQATLSLTAALNTNEVIARNTLAGRLRYSRSQRDLSAIGDIPLASRRNNFLPGLGELSFVWELGLTDVQLSWISAVAVLNGSLWRLPAGMLTDRVGGRIVTIAMLQPLAA